MSGVTVGELRQQSALDNANCPVVIVSDDDEIKRLRLRVIAVYPDTTDEIGNPVSTFKVEVERGV